MHTSSRGKFGTGWMPKKRSVSCSDGETLNKLRVSSSKVYSYRCRNRVSQKDLRSTDLATLNMGGGGEWMPPNKVLSITLLSTPSGKLMSNFALVLQEFLAGDAFTRLHSALVVLSLLTPDEWDRECHSKHQ